MEDNRLEIFCKLEYVGIDIDENLHLELSKKNKRSMEQIAKLLKATFEGKETYILLDLGRWKNEQS